MNSARLSPPLAALFPPGVIGAELDGAAEPSLLLPEEALAVRCARDARRREFAAGRLCARRALAELGYADFPLRTGADRRPLWPAQVIGSISHTRGACAAVVAPRRRYCAIGLDMEVVGSVTPDIWPIVCTAAESDWLSALPESAQALHAALIFSAKEAFYKCQFGLTGRWLDFQDVALDPDASAPGTGRFVLQPAAGGPHYHGAFVVRDGVIAAGVAMGAHGRWH